MKSTNNSRILLEGIVKDEFTARAPKSMKDVNKFFEFFVASQLLKDRELSDEEILSSISDNDHKRDGGIDGLFLFGNRNFLQNDSDFSDSSVNELELFVTQCKYTDKVPEEVIHKLEFAMKDLLDLGNDLNSVGMINGYDSKYLDIIKIFHDLYKKSRGGVKIRLNFAIAHLADDVAPMVFGKTNHLTTTVKQHIREAEVHIDFVNPEKLMDMIRREKKKEFTLTYKRDIISPDERGFTCLVNLYEFYKFIHDEEANQIREGIFDANVRDFQENNPVNLQIQETLISPQPSIDFWWLNNGVTMVANKVTRRADALIIQNPEIVNGLQTSYTIHKHFSTIAGNTVDEKRHILIRIIQMDESDDASRDIIIRATNNQTPIAPLLLHATETIHHNIEDYFRKKASPFYYERRKSYYKNKGRKVDEIVDIQVLAQAITAILLRRPNVARSFIKTFLRPNENYQMVFNSEYPLDFFYVCAFLRKRTQDFLSSDYFSIDPKRRSLARYVMHHIMTYSAILLTKNSYGPNSGGGGSRGLMIYSNEIAKINLSAVTDTFLKTSSDAVMTIFENNIYQATPNAAKIDDMANDIISLAVDNLKS